MTANSVICPKCRGKSVKSKKAFYVMTAQWENQFDPNSQNLANYLRIRTEFGLRIFSEFGKRTKFEFAANSICAFPANLEVYIRKSFTISQMARWSSGDDKVLRS